MRCLASLSLFFLCLVLAGPVHAHNRSESFSRWEYDGQVLSMKFTINAREVTRLPRQGRSGSAGQLLSEYLERQVVVHSLNGSCRLDRGFYPLLARPGFLQVGARWDCAGLPAALEVKAFFEVAAEHTHFASLLTPGHMRQRLLNRDNQLWQIDSDSAAVIAKTSQGGTFGAFLGLGFRHIISGFDHIVFLLALLLICRRPRDLLWAVTGFTLGHSFTLALVVVGMVQPVVPAIEAVIGLTIALVAVERVVGSASSALPLPLAVLCAVVILLMIPFSLGRNATLGAATIAGLSLFVFCYLQMARDMGGKGGFRIVLTILFGAIHGFGFAAAFLVANMGTEALLVPLAGFNIGVELGQLVLLTLMLMVAWALSRTRNLLLPAADITTAMVCGMGVFWFVQRSFS